MNSLISFDAHAAVATIALDDWPPILSTALCRIFKVEEGVLRLDLSHVSDARPTGDERRYEWRSNRVVLRDKLLKAAGDGRLELFIEILHAQDTVTAGSASVRDRDELAAFRRNGAVEYIVENLPKLRGAAIEEGTLDARWVRWTLADPSRSAFFREREIVDAILAKVPTDGYYDALSRLTPRGDDDNWAFSKFTSDRWTETQAFIADHIERARSHRGEDPVHRLVSLFRHSGRVQESRWACEQVLLHAHPTLLGDLITSCRQLSADDVRGLLQRLRDAPDDAEKTALEPGVGSAFLALSGTAGHLPSDLVLAGLWQEFEFAEMASPMPRQRSVMSALSELPTGSWRTDVLWEQLGPEARAAWRADLADRVAGDRDLTEGLIDFTCRWLDQAGFVEVEPVLRKLIDDDAGLAFLRRLADKGPRLVTLRALGLANAVLEVATSDAPAMDAPYQGLPDVGARTWLGDPSTERVIHQTMAEVEARFSTEYRDQWGADEEMLTADLLAKVGAAAHEAMNQLRQLTHTTKGRYPSISVKVRQPGKTEEGAKTSAGAPLAADILFLTRLEDGGKVLVERATFVQVKKRRGGTGESFGSTIPIDPEQCADLLTQSEHAFYLFLTPPSPRPRLWITPARLVGNLTLLHTSRSSVAALQARDASISFANFFLHQLVGLWAGDERKEALAIAKGDRRLGRTPRHIVEIVVQRRGD